LRPISPDIYARIDNGLYDTQGDSWWRPESAFHQLRISINPVRTAYAARVLARLGIEANGRAALEVGSGGGFLCEEIARLGFVAAGIDPSSESLAAAVRHAKASGLAIQYEQAAGEALPFPAEAFDAVFCCDVLEHVRDLPQTISEISRVLIPGGVFCYDTINRTCLSRLAAVKIAQEWKCWAFMPERLHVWEMFIKPCEMKILLEENGLDWKEHRGMKPNVPLVEALRLLRDRAKGTLTYRELGERITFVEGKGTAVMYLGYAVKR
jgi:2-polyprenyl-6-hydroxyphenyl methylase/3-demethylubiquinone-9 3-methyltransferase